MSRFWKVLGFVEDVCGRFWDGVGLDFAQIVIGKLNKKAITFGNKLLAVGIVYFILYPVYCILCIVYCVLYTVCCIL